MAYPIEVPWPCQDVAELVCGLGENYAPYRADDTVTATLSWASGDTPTSASPKETYQRFRQIFIDALMAYEKSGVEANNIKIDNIIEEIRQHYRNEAAVVKINVLGTKALRQPLDALVESDGNGFIARAIDFPLFGYGDDRAEAIDALKSEIESLYFDLIEDDNFTEEWRGIKAFLKQQVLDD